MIKILITGSAGFIGFHLANRLIADGCEVVGLDNINEYYDVELKYSRLKAAGIEKESIIENTLIVSKKNANYSFIKLDLTNPFELNNLFKAKNFDIVINLAAQAGVRYSITNPEVYIQSNIAGFFNLLEACRKNEIKKIIFASSSSVYGNNKKVPFDETDNTDNPISLYAATKKSNELMAYAYSHLYGISAVCLRFFTVYGPWGRPDMAYFKFAKAIIEDTSIEVYNQGNLFRDFTFIGDVVEGIADIVSKLNKQTINEKRGLNNISFNVYNIGNSNPVKLTEFISQLEKIIGKTANLKNIEMQKGDVDITHAGTKKISEEYGFKCRTDLHDGLTAFVDWYKDYKKTQF